MKKMLLMFVLLAMMVLAACTMDAPGSDSEETTGGEEASGDYTVGFSISTLNNPFFVTLSEGAEAKASELGASLSVVDAQDDASKQASDVEDLIQQGVDMILINPVDSEAVASAVASANNADIPVITVDRSAESGEVVSHIASDNVAGGEMAAEHLLSLVGDGAQVAELEGVPGSSAARERGEGFNNIAADSMDVVAKQTANFNRAEGLSVMENILQANPDVTGVFAHNDEMALGALEAIEASGKDVTVVGFDATDDAVAAVEEGRLAGTIAQKPEMIGEMAVETAIQHLDGEEVEASIPVELELIEE
ncbi:MULTISPECIES: ribose ABC transporter substrate-binding protein RbsB [unclassified Planococcus (in: firmicutes)]|uniref:ribose ABC transporter substrate-binding protein RbsB n=1 Tax=unclassified Planococcus (in: firmicutes) TaxID=2662419 RepID=UPI000C32B3BD|nr:MULTISPECIES: ribose ABC transporter substrate-binding protein RbsB [unclassified Planococcus (in: firmicutes)]AUD14745.1 ribose ABC transporter substrate-binding protein RbsB [Planococcus sp. MB-3u-03]PKG45056.1 ribose ABC transporter substrate-binding protein RbsB [Planococcus sp. Urea-trap-24]PKG87399.1 ribose ABC transporter substrate-binding protein RbsB [Planococcus sp. Urea-3u-39]PKH42524.1 ribose ABC transporter substrate-binding protein RbsB [Planococcus sp. MB-3u-09]